MENQILLLGTGSDNNEIEEAKRLFYTEEAGFLPINYYIGVDPISDRTIVSGMAMQVYTKCNLTYKTFNNKRKLAKRRNRYSRLIKDYSVFYKNIKLMKE